MPKLLASVNPPFDFGGTDLSDRIKAKRQSLGLTQSDLAEKMGMDRKVGQVNLAGWEGRTRRPSIEALCKLAIALACTPNDLLGFSLKKQPKRKP